MENGLFVISLDFEMFWGLHDSYSAAESRESVLNEYKVVPGLLKLFDEYGIHATWATVGSILAQDKTAWQRYIPEMRPEYINPLKSSYRLAPVIGTEEYPSEMFFAPSLVNMIRNAPNQEIGSHTFSHFYCLEEGETREAFMADAAQAAKIASDFGIPALKAIVLPKNQVNPAYLTYLRDAGFIVYRGEEDNWIHNRVKNGKVVRALRLLNNYLPLTGSDSFTVDGPVIPGLYNVMASRFLRPYNRKLGILEPLKLFRIKSQMRKAAQKREIYHLWWHPHNFGKNTEINLHQTEKILSYYRKLSDRYGMQSTHMTEVCHQAAQNPKVMSGKAD